MNYSDVKGKYLDPYFVSDLPFTSGSTQISEVDWLKANHLREVEELPISEILWNGKYNKYVTSNGGATCSCCSGERFRKANWKDFPIWLMKHDCTKGEKYIIMDGRHRLRKAMADGQTTIKAYVYSLDELLSYLPK